MPAAWAAATASCRDDHAHHFAPAPRCLDPLAEAHAVDQLHRDERVVLEVADVEHGHDRGMRESRECLRFTMQARAMCFAQSIATHDLERDATIELWIVRGVDGAHAAVAELRKNYVAAEPRRRLFLFFGCCSSSRAVRDGLGRVVFGITLHAQLPQ